MILLGLTGGIGSGKSVVAEVIRHCNIKIYNSDEEAKKLLYTEAIVKELVKLFGSSIIVSDGGLDRKNLASVVFNDSDALKKLNDCIHPRVWDDFTHWIAQNQKEELVVLESAILFESGFNVHFHKIACVTAPVSMRIHRIMQRDQANEKEISARIAAQWPEEKKKALSDFIINNDETMLVVPQVLKMLNQLLGGYAIMHHKY